MKIVNIGEKLIGDSYPVFIIAEAGLNHGGDLNVAIKMVEEDANAGADAIKFQAFDTNTRFGNDESIKALVRPTELGEAQFRHLADVARTNHILFFSSVFDEESVEMLVRLGVEAVKIASCDIKNEQLLRKAAESGKTIVLSRGTGNELDIDGAIRIFESSHASYILMHCVSSYPLEDIHANLRAIHSLRARYDGPIGYSDHTRGITVPIASVYAGATVIEKHFTQDRDLKGIDWELSANPDEFKTMVQKIRQGEHILGHGRIEPLSCEKEEIEYRDSLRISKIN